MLLALERLNNLARTGATFCIIRDFLKQPADILPLYDTFLPFAFSRSCFASALFLIATCIFLLYSST